MKSPTQLVDRSKVGVQTTVIEMKGKERNLTTEDRMMIVLLEPHEEVVDQGFHPGKRIGSVGLSICEPSTRICLPPIGE